VRQTTRLLNLRDKQKDAALGNIKQVLMAFLMCGFFELQGGDQNSGAMKWRSTSHEGKFHEWAKVPQGREIPI